MLEILKVEDIKKVAVIGVGLMGSQIAELLSQVGKYKVSMTDISDEFISKGLTAMEQRLDKFFVSKGKMTPEEKKGITGRIQGTTDISKAVSAGQCGTNWRNALVRHLIKEDIDNA